MKNQEILLISLINLWEMKDQLQNSGVPDCSFFLKTLQNIAQIKNIKKWLSVISIKISCKNQIAWMLD